MSTHTAAASLADRMSLTGLTALVTGASRGMARDVAERSSAEGPGAVHPSQVATAFDARVAALAADELVARWSDRLEGLEVFAADHVVTMADSLRWDYNVTGGGLPPAI